MNRTKTGTKTDWTPLNTGKFTGLQFGTWVNIALGEFRALSHDTNLLSNKKFWVYLRHEIFSGCWEMRMWLD